MHFELQQHIFSLIYLLSCTFSALDFLFPDGNVCSDKFVLLYPVGSLMSSMMDSTDVKLYLCKTKCRVKATTNFAPIPGLRWCIYFFNIVSMSFLSCFPEFFHIPAFLFLLSWHQDLAETPFSWFCISWCLSAALFSLLSVCRHLLTHGKGWSMVKWSCCN